MARLDVAALRHRDFAQFLTGQFLWTSAMQIQFVALGWLIYDLTGSPFYLGLIGLLEFLPSFVLALVTGHVADRLDRRRIVLVGVGAELLVAVALVAFSLSESMPVSAILTAALVFGIARAIATPAARALMPNLMPREDFASAVAWSSSSWQVANIGAPALGGFLYALSPSAAFIGTAVAVAGAMAATFVMRGRKVTQTSEPTDLAAVAAGLLLIFRHKLLLGAISLDLFAVLFSGAVALLPVFAKDVLMVGPEGLGILRSATGIGAVATALVLTQLPLKRHVGRRMFLAVGLFGMGVVAFGLSTHFWLSFAILMVMGAADMVSVYVRGTLVPLATPDALRGRVVAVETVFIGASNELGAFVAGSGAALLGAVPAVVIGGGLTLLVTIVWSRLFPGLRKVDRFEDAAAG
jgi:MFS family permease